MVHEVHILIGCADARDLNQIQVEEVNRQIQAYAERGIRVDFYTIRAAGSFITDDVYHDIKRIILDNQRERVKATTLPSYAIHIQTHGHLTEDSNKDYLSHIYEMKIVEGSPLNCGMMGATGLGVELEQLLVESALTVYHHRGKIEIKGPEDIRLLMRMVYGHDGYLAGDWIRSIDYLRTHPRTQRARLEKLVAQDAELSNLNIRVTAGILDYSIHALIRLDDGDPAIPFWDQIQARIRERASGQLATLRAQTEKQEPIAGLLCMSDPRQSSRSAALRWYLHHRGLDASGDEAYRPNRIFNLSGSSFDIPHTPFGPYVIAGFYYAVKHLGLQDHIVLGYDEAQTQRILKKIEHDPIMNLIVQHFGVNLIPLRQEEIV